jgi:prophage regulatory protein
MSEISQATQRILRRKQVQEYLGLARSTIYAKLDTDGPYYDPTFPKPFKLGNGARMIGWLESDVEAWVQQCANQRFVASDVKMAGDVA